MVVKTRIQHWTVLIGSQTLSWLRDPESPARFWAAASRELTNVPPDVGSCRGATASAWNLPAGAGRTAGVK
jgi:hypothetical protein